MTSARFIGEIVDVVIDRPAGSTHPKFGYIYPINYGFIPNVMSGDGEELDAYIIGVDAPVARFRGRCVAVIVRESEDDDKLIVAPDGADFSDDEIERAVEFQEKWFSHKLVRR